ncbi:MAG: hypothetical protein K2W96_26860 [Gemmataceae bacterium]|nr:hypothetical protein [Gemmataceae bacterium]
MEDDLAALDGKGPVLGPDRAGRAAVGARLLGIERLGLEVEEGAEGAFGEGGGGNGGGLFHGQEIGGGVGGAGLPEGPAGDDPAPSRRQLADLLELLGREDALRHGWSCLSLASLKTGTFLFYWACPALGSAKCVLTSSCPPSTRSPSRGAPLPVC